MSKGNITKDSIINAMKSWVYEHNLQLIKDQIKSINTMSATPLSWKFSKNLFTTASTFIINNKYSLKSLLNFFITLAKDHQIVDYLIFL